MITADLLPWSCGGLPHLLSRQFVSSFASPAGFVPPFAGWDGATFTAEDEVPAFPFAAEVSRLR